MNVYRFSTGEETVELPLVPDVRKIYVEATTACNFACVTCVRRSWQSAIGHMDNRTFNRLMEQLSQLPRLDTVHFGGFGEPLTNPNILFMLAACKAAGYKVEMITNGALLDIGTVDQLIEMELDWLYVSLDGPSAECFDQIRPGADFSLVVNNIDRLQKRKRELGRSEPRLGIEFVATKQNIAALPAMRRLVDELRADNLLITNVLPYHSSMKDEILYDGQTYPEGYDHDSALSLLAAPCMKLYTRRNCKFVEDKSLTVSFMGRVSPCYAMLHDYECYIFGRQKEMRAYAFGDIHETPLEEIWTNPRYAYFRWMVRNSQYPSCTDCRQADGCALSRSNEADCWGNQPSCGDCLWARGIIVCP